MNEKWWIFVSTDEGCSSLPKYVADGEDYESLDLDLNQVLGIHKGLTVEEAFNDMINDRDYLQELALWEVTAYPLDDNWADNLKILSREDYKPRKEDCNGKE